MTHDVWADPELHYLADDIGLLAIADVVAVAGTAGRRSWRGLPTTPRRRSAKRPLVLAGAAAVAALLVTSAAFGVANNLWRTLTGTPVATTSLAPADWSILSAVSGANALTPPKSLAADGLSDLRLLGSTSGRSFYALTRSDGTTCYASGPEIGSAGASSGLLGAVGCPTGAGAFPSQANPIIDFSVFHSPDRTGPVSLGSTFVWRLAGVATDPVSSVAIQGADGRLYDTTAVANNVYDVEALQPLPVAPHAIVALNSSGGVVYSKCVAPVGSC